MYTGTGGYLVTCLPHPQITYTGTWLPGYLPYLVTCLPHTQIAGGSLITELPRNRTLMKNSLLPISSHYCCIGVKGKTIINYGAHRRKRMVCACKPYASDRMFKLINSTKELEAGQIKQLESTVEAVRNDLEG